MTLATRSFPIFFIQPSARNKVQYHEDGNAIPSEGDVSKVTWFPEMMAEVPKP